MYNLITNLLNITYNDTSYQNRLEYCLAPLNNYLAKVYKEYDTFRAGDDFNLNYFKIDTNRIVNNCKNANHIDLTLHIIAYDISDTLFKIIINYISYHKLIKIIWVKLKD